MVFFNILWILELFSTVLTTINTELETFKKSLSITENTQLLRFHFNKVIPDDMKFAKYFTEKLESGKLKHYLLWAILIITLQNYCCSLISDVCHHCLDFRNYASL